MRIASLGSGSSGNATLVDTGEGLILIDCGFSTVEVERRLERLGCNLNDIAAILVTHEHSDHLGGIGSLCRKLNLPAHLTHGTARKLADKHSAMTQVIRPDQPFNLLGTHIHPVPVPHDAREPVQFVFSKAGFKLGVLTDLGSLTAHILDSYRGCQMLLVEANHDLEMLMSGPYPVALKKRVGGRWGHLNNQQTAEFIRAVNGDACLHTLVIGHISKQNNHLDRVRDTLSEVTRNIDQIHYAQQDSPLSWVSCEAVQEKKSA